MLCPRLTLSSASFSLSLTTLFHYIHRSPLWSPLVFLLFLKLQHQHPFTNIIPIPPLNASKSPQSGFLAFIFKISDMSCSSDAFLISDLIHPSHLREYQHKFQAAHTRLLPPYLLTRATEESSTFLHLSSL